jgi:hypothetical protein
VGRQVHYHSDNNHAGEIQPEVPSYLHFLQHPYRALNFTHVGVAPKLFFNTQIVLTLFVHYPMDCFGGECIGKDVPIEYEQLQHYREGCGPGLAVEVCDSYRNNTVKDLNLWRFKDEIVKNVEKALEEISNIP